MELAVQGIYHEAQELSDMRELQLALLLGKDETCLGEVGKHLGLDGSEFLGRAGGEEEVVDVGYHTNAKLAPTLDELPDQFSEHVTGGRQTER